MASVTGIGAMSCVGAGADALWRAALDGISGLRDGLGVVSEMTIAGAREIYSQNPTFGPLKWPASRSEQLALLALEQALGQAGWDGLRPTDGLILATTTGQIPVWDKALTSYLNKRLSKVEFLEAFEHQPLGDLLRSLTRALSFDGKQILLTSACAASTQALALAAMWLDNGLVDRCLVGGVEVLCDLTVHGFSCLQLLSSQASAPFDENRAGINLSEGAGFVCLEKSAPRRALAELKGFGMTSDGHHMTAPHPEGRGCFEAMKRALASAGVSPGSIDWIHAHGTASVQNDVAEAAAIAALFSESTPWVSSTKWVHGHALGASGIIESILCIKALGHQTVLNTHGLTHPDRALSLRHPERPTRQEIRHVLKNTLGFGGTNAALVWSRADLV